MKHELVLSDILQIENSAEVLAICCPDTGIPLWTTIRSPFLRLILGDMLYSMPLVNQGGAIRSSSRLRAASLISQSFVHNAIRLGAFPPRHPVVLMATGARLIKREERYFNSLSDHFIAAAPDRTLAVEDLFDWKWPFPRHHNNMLLHTPLHVEGALMGRMLAGRFREPARELVNLVSQRAKDILGWSMGEERHQWLERCCATGAASLLPRYRRYQSIFKKVGARLLIKEEACYGSADNASAILAAKHLGVVTAEYQHGMVSTGHDAYNFAPAILNDHAYRQIFPDYFLTFGSWWGNQINAPVEKLAIGNPHRAQTLEVSSPIIVQGQQILVLGEGVETAAYLEFCERIAVALAGTHEVVFRPHPLQRASVWDKYPAGFVGKIRVDSHQDIYSSFREAGVVVGEASTGLFEAIGLVPKIFIWDTPKARFSYPTHPFHRFSDVNELAQLIRDESAGRVNDQQMESIWAPNWQRNYLDFIEMAIR